MALVVVHLEIVVAIVYAIWTISVIVEVYSNHKNEKSNKELMDEIHKSNDLNDQLLAAVKKYTESTDKKATAEANFLWESVIILAKRIHDLEDNYFVK